MGLTMSDTNPFHEAVEPPPKPAGGKEVTDYPHFFQSVIDQKKRERQARNMSREDMFRNGFITVEDLDDEELRLGRCRDSSGRIPGVTNKTEMVPRDLYDEMVAEHQRRYHEKTRQQLDKMLEIMIECATDESAEWKERTDAAKYLMERVVGKTPERVNVSVTKAPWEELLGDVAHITRAQHLALQEGAIDAEVVEVHDVQPHHEAANVHGAPTDTHVPEGVPPVHAPSETNWADTGVATQDPNLDRAQGGSQPRPRPDVEDDQPRVQFVDPTFAPPSEAPSFTNLARSNPVGEQTLSEHLRAADQEARRIADARTTRRKIIDEAKKRRKAQRATGADIFKRNLDTIKFGKVQERFDPGPDEPGGED